MFPTILLNAAAFPHPVYSLRLIETALSWVILSGEYAYKIKKPLHTDFIDASSLEGRHFLCQQELRLNQRFSKDLYLSVVPIGVDERGIGINRGECPVEYAVQMRQFDQSKLLAHALAHSHVSVAEMSCFGADLARVHRNAPSTPPSAGYAAPTTVRAQVMTNFPPLREALQIDLSSLKVLDALEDWTRSALRRACSRLALRHSNGYVRECHADLHTGNIVHWNGEWQAFDCLEFDPALRWIDVVSDVAFIVMDLCARERPDLGFALLNAYLEYGGDYEGLPLLPLYAVYRALVRAKVAVLSQHVDLLHRYLRTAEAIINAPQGALILMHGLAASGKSSIAAQLAQMLPAIRVRSDIERRRFGASWAAPGCAGQVDAGLYSAAGLLTTYRRLRFCADSALAAGYNVIVDATFLERAWRRAFEALARLHGCPLLVVSCEAPLEVLEQRLRERQSRGDDPSEATAAVLAAQWRNRQPLETAEQAHVVTIDTTRARAVTKGIALVRQRAGALSSRPFASMTCSASTSNQ